MTETFYNNVYRLFVDLRAQALAFESEILSADDPKMLTIGLACEKTGDINLDNSSCPYVSHSRKCRVYTRGH